MKHQETKERAKEAFEKVRPQARDLAAESVAQGIKAGLAWMLVRPRKSDREKEEKHE